MISWSALTSWDFDDITSYIVPFIRQLSGLHLSLSAIQAIVLRYLTEFVWKRVPPFQNDFMTLFLTINNIFFGSLLPIITCNSGSFSEVERLQGKSSYLKERPTFNPKYVHFSAKVFAPNSSKIATIWVKSILHLSIK